VSAIGPGDWVECVKTTHGVNNGRIFCVAAIDSGDRPCVDMHGPCGALYLTGLPGGPYATCAFRPIYRPKSDLIQSLLKPVNR
jgi:hypothetical protein